MPIFSRSTRGFSLIELLTALVVVSVLAALAVPALTDFQAESARSRFASEFLASLMRARSQAIASGRPAFICPRGPTSDNVPTCATGTDWSNGILVVAPTTPTIGAALPDSVITWEYAPTDTSVKVTQLANGNSVLAAPIRFSPVGSIGGGSLALWTICRTTYGSKVAMNVGSLAVLQFNGNASLETKNDCPNS